MKQTTAFWVLWHAILIVAVAGGFYAFRHHVLNRAIVVNGHHLDEGIPLAELIPLVKGIADQHPDCRVLSVDMHYRVLEIKTAWISDAHKGIQFGFSETDGEWSESYGIHSPIEGVSPADLLTILELTRQELTDLMDKRILSVTILNGKVEIMTGVTDHNTIGGGNTLTYEKIGKEWVIKAWGHWIS